jgi:hypothetical protein
VKYRIHKNVTFEKNRCLRGRDDWEKDFNVFLRREKKMNNEIFSDFRKSFWPIIVMGAALVLLPFWVVYPAGFVEPCVPLDPDPPCITDPVWDCVDDGVDCSSALCDIMILPWDATWRSPDIHFEVPLDPSGSPTEEDVIFHYDQMTNVYSANLYAAFHQVPPKTVCCGDVVMTFSFREIPVVSNPTFPIDYTVPAGWTPIGTHTMKLCGGDATDSRLPYDDGITLISRYAQQQKVVWSLPANTEPPQAFLIKVEIDWSHDEDDANDRAYSYYVRELSAQPVDLMLVHDMSGSMSTYGYVAPAKDKAQMLSLQMGSSDSLGVVSFGTGRSSNTSFTGSIESDIYSETTLDCPLGPLSAPNQITDALNAINVMETGGCTPIGQGLIRARDQIIASGINTNQAIVLLSDGEENVAPIIHPPIDETCGSGPFDTVFDTGTLENSDIDITVYPIVLGPSQAWAENLLEALATATDGKRIFTPLDDFDLGAAYQMIREYATFDDMLIFERGETGGNNQYTFNLETMPDELLFSLQWPFDNGETQLDLKFGPTGEETDYRALKKMTIHRGKSFLIVRIPNPQATQWDIEVVNPRGPGTGTPYTLAVYTDRVGIQFTPQWQTRVFKTGEPIVIEVRGLYHRTPFSEALVKATARIPIRGVSKLLRQYRERLQDVTKGLDPDKSKVVQLVHALKKIVGNEPLVKYKEVDFLLKDDGQTPDKKAGDGIYTGHLVDTPSAGMYDIRLSAGPKADSPIRFNWSYEISALVKVGDIDSGKSKIEIKTVKQPDKPGGPRLVEVVILPVDVFDNPLKPGYAADFKVTSSQGTLVGKVKDNRDSSYSQFLRLDPGEVATVRVKVRGAALEPAYTVPFKKYELSAHLGLAIPGGNLSNTFDPGPAFALDFGYRLTTNFAVKAIYSLNRFNDPLDGFQSIQAFNGYLQYRHLFGGWNPYFESGLGFYLVENGPEVGGVSLGIGGMVPINQGLSLDFSGHFHQLFDGNNTRFLQLFGGLIFKF